MKKYLIYGAGLSGNALKDLLGGDETSVVYDDNLNRTETTFDEAVKLLNSIDKLILSPGVPYSAKLIQMADNYGVEVIGETEYAAKLCKGRIVAVTGTNGKTTVTQLIYHILQESGRKSYLLGNVGTPLSAYCRSIGKDDIVVLETSSFQLERNFTFHPYISAITSLHPDHLDRHHTFDNYCNVKSNVFLNQREDDYAVFNYDDEVVRRLSARCKAGKKFYGFDTNCDCYCIDKTIKCGSITISLSNTEYYYKHSIQNLMCAVQICSILGVEQEQIQRAISIFVPDKHRIEFVCEKDGVRFYDDSKGTNIHSTLASTKCFDSIALILGGSDKGYEFDELFTSEGIRNVKSIAVFGATSDKILAAAKRNGFEHIVRVKDIFQATDLCYSEAKKDGSVVLLSPACASFDMFANYEQRGEIFADYARKK